MDENLTREERINKYAYQWYEYYRDRGEPPDRLRDWLRGEHIVEAQDRAEIIGADYKFRLRPSRMKC